jgi:hypothetical protein
MPPLSESERDQVLRGSLLYGRYENTIDRESAYEVLTARAKDRQRDAEAAEAEKQREIQQRTELQEMERQLKQERQRSGPTYYSPEYGPTYRRTTRRTTRSRAVTPEQIIGSLARSAASSLGRQLVRGLMGSLRSR